MFLIVTNITLAKRKKYDGELSNKVDGFHFINSDLDLLFYAEPARDSVFPEGRIRIQGVIFSRVGSASSLDENVAYGSKEAEKKTYLLVARPLTGGRG